MCHNNRYADVEKKTWPMLKHNLGSHSIFCLHRMLVSHKVTKGSINKLCQVLAGSETRAPTNDKLADSNSAHVGSWLTNWEGQGETDNSTWHPMSYLW